MQNELWAWERKSEKKEKDWSREFQTPPNVCKYMVSLIPLTGVRILEPTPGIGNLVSELRNAGYQVSAPENFFLLDRSEKFDCVVMNPPFSSRYTDLIGAPVSYRDSGMKCGYKILQDCMRLSDDVIALMPWFTISDSDKRLDFLMHYGLQSLTALPRKTFKGARVQTVVLHLKKGFNGSTIFNSLRWSERKNDGQMQLF